VLHIPLCPSSQRGECQGTAWPCDAAKIDLIAGYHGMRISLSRYLAGLYIEAMNDIYVRGADPSTPDPRQLYERFVGWGNPAREQKQG
jgi:hypothetical protein